MADLSVLKLPNNQSYSIKDSSAVASVTENNRTVTVTTRGGSSTTFSTAYEVASTTSDGLLSKEDKSLLSTIDGMSANTLIKTGNVYVYVDENGYMLTDDSYAVSMEDVILTGGSTLGLMMGDTENNLADADYSVAIGTHVTAASLGSVAFGKYNDGDASYAFTVGNGTAENARSNAISVSWAGDVTVAGVVSAATPTASSHLTTKAYVDGKFLPLTGGTLSGTLTGTTFIGNLTGTATKVSNSITISVAGGTTEGTNKITFDGQTAKSLNITKDILGLGNVDNTADANKSVASAGKVGNKLTISVNGGTTEGTNKFTFDGSADKTLDITKSAIGLGNVTNNAQIKGLASGTTSGHIVTFGSDGYTVQDSGYTIATSVPANAVFTDTVYTHPSSGVTAGTYNSVTVNAQGHITSGNNYTFENRGFIRCDIDSIVEDNTSTIKINISEPTPQKGAYILLHRYIYDDHARPTLTSDKYIELYFSNDSTNGFSLVSPTTQGVHVNTWYTSTKFNQNDWILCYIETSQAIVIMTSNMVEEATTTTPGIMSATDKSRLDSIYNVGSADNSKILAVVNGVPTWTTIRSVLGLTSDDSILYTS